MDDRRRRNADSEERRNCRNRSLQSCKGFGRCKVVCGREVDDESGRYPSEGTEARVARSKLQACPVDPGLPVHVFPHFW
jgi:hypothetical protein